MILRALRTLLLAACVAAMLAGRGHSAGAVRPVELRYDGSLQLEGHYAKPHERRTFTSSRRFLWSGPDRIRLEWTMRAAGDSVATVETTVLTDGRVFQQEDRGAPWTELSGDAAIDARWAAMSGLPWMFAPLSTGALHERPDRRATSMVTRTADGVPAPGATTAPGVLAVDERWAHPRLGDVRDTIRYGPAVTRNGMRAPSSIHMNAHQRDIEWGLSEKLATARAFDGHDSLWRAPARATAPRERPAPSAARADSIAPGVWTFTLEDMDSRSLAVGFDDHVVLLETSATVEAGERIARAVEQRFPGRPVRYVLFSHHHPHYTGGLRPFVASGARVVVMPGNAAYVREIAAYRFRMDPDRLAREPQAAQVENISNGRWIDAVGSQQLVALDVGSYTDHTAEYLIFHLPQARFLFVGDLGWYAGPDGTPRAGRRAAGLLRAIHDLRLDVDRIGQSWPTGTKPVVSLAELDSMVAARGR